MKKKWIIFAPFKNLCFEGSDLDGAIFGDERARFFDTKEEAEQRLYEEYSYKPTIFINMGLITILETFEY